MASFDNNNLLLPTSQQHQYQPGAEAVVRASHGAAADGGDLKQQQPYSYSNNNNDDDATNKDTSLIWNDTIASALGYGKRGRSGAAFAWWITAACALGTLGSFIAWCVLTQRAARATDAAMAAYGVADLPAWNAAKAMLVATAVLYPILVLFALGVSAWRASLARRLDIHRLDSRWLRGTRAWQAANAAASTLLWLLLLGLVLSVAGHGAWLFTSYAGTAASRAAITYIDPVWTPIARVINTTQSVTGSFVGQLGGQLGAALPVLGRRRALLAEQYGLEPAALAAFLDAEGLGSGGGGGGGGVDGADFDPTAAGRTLQQAPAPIEGLANVGRLADAVGGVLRALPPLPQLNIPQLNLSGIPGLSTLAPPGGNGSNSPLLEGLSDLTNLVEQQLLNRTGCPIYCIDLRNVDALTGDRCVCNLDRVKAGEPLLAGVLRDVWPAFALAVVMWVTASWLLLHGAAQWARTRTEAKLMRRKPTAARVASLVAASSATAMAAAPPPPPPPPLHFKVVGGGSPAIV